MNILETLKTHDNETYQMVMSFKEKIKSNSSDAIVNDMKSIISRYLSRVRELCKENETITLSDVLKQEDKMKVLTEEYRISKNALLSLNEGFETIAKIDYFLRKNDSALKALLDLFFTVMQGLSVPVLEARCEYDSVNITDSFYQTNKPVRIAPVFKPAEKKEEKKPDLLIPEPKKEEKVLPTLSSEEKQGFRPIAEEKPIGFRHPEPEAVISQEERKLPFAAPIQLIEAENEVVEDIVTEEVKDDGFKITFEDKTFFFIDKKVYSLKYEGEAEGYEFVGYENNDKSEVGEHIVKATFRSADGKTKTVEAKMTITDIVDGVQYLCVGESAHVAGYDENIQRNVVIPPYIKFSDRKYIVDEIEKEAFDSCPKAKEIVVPNTVKKIGAGAFVDCSKLTRLTLPFVGGDPKSNDSYISYIFGGKRETDNQFFLPKSLETIVITNQDEVKPGAFQGCRYLKNITICRDCRTIGKNAFCKCESLETLNNTDRISNIQDNAFQGCKKLKSFNINKSIQKVGDHAFKDCFILKFYSYIPLDKIKEPMFRSTWNENGRPIVSMVK